MRVDCPQCRRPEGLCVCDALRAAAPHATPVTIVQHPRERRHPFGTARLARRALAGVEVAVAWPTPDGLRCPVPLPGGAALLYPSADAAVLGPGGPRPSALVVLDGTWALVRQLLRDPALAALPRVTLAPAAPGEYRIRREPAAHCLSTVESIVRALSALEPANDALPAALDGFRALVDRQLAHLEGLGSGRQRRASRRPTVRRLLGDRERVVVVYAEVLHPPGGVRLVQWAARRPGGEALELFVRPDPPASPAELARRGLDPERVAAAPPALDRDRWAAFCRPDDVLVAWSDLAVPLFERTLGEPVARAVDLKSAWCNRERGPAGTLPALVARLGLTVPPVPGVSGRAAERLGNATAVLEHLLASP